MWLHCPTVCVGTLKPSCQGSTPAEPNSHQPRHVTTAYPGIQYILIAQRITVPLPPTHTVTVTAGLEYLMSSLLGVCVWTITTLYS